MTSGVEAPLQLARTVLAGRQVWVVGGLVRDRALAGDALDARIQAAPRRAPGGAHERAPVDVDLVVRDDPAEIARALGRAGSGASFPLSQELGAWRVVARDGSWQIDVEPVRGETLQEDLSQRDFTINAVAQTLDGAETIDPLGGLRDLAARRLRAASPQAFQDDPLRVLRLVRLAHGLHLDTEEATVASAQRSARGLLAVSGERVFSELKLIVGGDDPVSGLNALGDVGATAVVLPELDALRGVAQGAHHQADAYGHTMEVLAQTVALCSWYLDGGAGQRGAGDGSAEQPGADDGRFARLAGPGGDGVAALLGTSLADGLTRSEALRWGALLHDAGKRDTRGTDDEGGVTFDGHDARGGEIARAVMVRMRTSQRLRDHVAALVRHHARLSSLAAGPPPAPRRTVYRYLRTCSPVEVDVTLLSVADRVATSGNRPQGATSDLLDLARSVLDDALRWHEQGPPEPLWRGDELARELDIDQGPLLGRLLEGLREAQYAGEVVTREQAVASARAQLPEARAHR